MFSAHTYIVRADSPYEAGILLAQLRVRAGAAAAFAAQPVLRERLLSRLSERVRADATRVPQRRASNVPATPERDLPAAA
jgi:hypothetical protein